jgi:hypothetical protein
VSLSEIYFWAGRCAVWKGKVRQAELILVPIFSSQRLQKLQAGAAANCDAHDKKKGEGTASAGPGFSLSGSNSPGCPWLWPSSEQTQRNAFASWSDYRESKRARQQQQWKV